MRPDQLDNSPLENTLVAADVRRSISYFPRRRNNRLILEGIALSVQVAARTTSIVADWEMTKHFPPTTSILPDYSSSSKSVAENPVWQGERFEQERTENAELTEEFYLCFLRFLLFI